MNKKNIFITIMIILIIITATGCTEKKPIIKKTGKIIYVEQNSNNVYIAFEDLQVLQIYDFKNNITKYQNYLILKGNIGNDIEIYYYYQNITLLWTFEYCCVDSYKII